MAVSREIQVQERPLPPSSNLPLMKQIAHTPIVQLLDAVDSLRQIYNPEVRGICSDESSFEDEVDVLTQLRHDDFERAYAIRWLTSLIRLTEELDSRHAQYAITTTPSDATLDHRDDSFQVLIADAASLLSACAGTASSGTVMRTYDFSVATCLRLNTPTKPPEERFTDERVRIKLSDIPLDNGDYASVGAQTWGAAVVLSRLILEDPGPSAFGIHLGQTVCTFDGFGMSSDPDCDGDRRKGTFRVLELGAGTGLVGIAVAKLLALLCVQSEVILTDFYPTALENLRRNVEANAPSEGLVDVSVQHLDWSTYASNDDLSLGEFDLILGADIVYEAKHAEWIRSCLFKLLRKVKDKRSFFHLLLPLRRTHETESRTVDDIFHSKGQKTSNEQDSDRLVVLKTEHIVKSAFSNRCRGTEDVQYAYYKIGFQP